MISKKKRDVVLRERAFVKGETDVSLSPTECDEKYAGTTGKLTKTVLWLRVLDRTRITDSYEDKRIKSRFCDSQDQYLRTLGRVVGSVSRMNLNL